MFAQSLLFVTRRWARDGGVGAHVIASAAALAAHGVRVDVFAARIEFDEDIPGVTLHERSALFDADAPMYKRLGETLAHPIDAVHVHQLDDPDIVRSLRSTAPVVVSAHGYTACT
ncbi:MAG TPA: glycosyltransferase, partial [Solirubrobacteraceae bacterium]|nr:glycosyltransferase [Solirubrobacteraceae bacterium]